VLAQAIGRWGNWFNQELYGKPTTLPWGLKIDRAHRVPGYESYQTFHPTYLYEFFWDLGTAGLVIWADRRFKLGHGRAFALYVMAYTAGRGWIEALRIDTVEANDVFGLRLNVWTSIVMFIGATAYFVIMGRLRPGREESVWRPGRGPDATDAEAEPDGDQDGDLDAEPTSDENEEETAAAPEKGRHRAPPDKSGEPDLR
jgi:prolipoprotein diacylglyceryl transferase